MESTQNKIQVAESGNKRTVISEDDVRQAVNDIKNWFQENHPDYFGKTLKDKPSVAGNPDGVKQFLSQHPHSQSPDIALAVILELCPEGFQFLDTFRLHKLGDINFAKCDDNEMLLIADDNLDGLKLAVTSTGGVLIFDPSDQTISEDLQMSFGKYVESIRDNLLLRKLHYEGEELGLVSSA